MKNLPEEFCIKHAINPLWGKFINWLNKNYNADYNGFFQTNYYGITKCNNSRGEIMAYNHGNQFAIVITLEQWNKAVNMLRSELPNTWCISRNLTPTQNEAVTDWVNKTFDVAFNSHKFEGYYLINTSNFKITWGSDKLDYDEISFEEFNFHVLDDKYVEPKVPKLIGYKAPINLFNDTIVAGDVLVIQDRPDTYQVKRIPKYFTLPHEIVEKWEKVYEEESIELILGTMKDKILIEKGSISYRGQKIKVLDLSTIVNTLTKITRLTIIDYPVSIVIDDLNKPIVRIGCESENHLFSINELQSVIDAYEKLNK